MPKFDVAKEYGKFPFGRFKNEGSQTAEGLVELLEPLLLERSELTVDFRGVVGMGASFFDGVASGVAEKIHDDIFREQLLTDQQKSLSSESQMQLIKSRIVVVFDPMLQELYQGLWQQYMKAVFDKEGE